ncbi:MAG: Bax inhibitor-1/YccA family protein [Erysipelotrichia bacterium]|nr:Bax inhibitor-1/YccA family protein [Erysipelotrichia bacterium]NCC55421.1 Bax inhibitor-1/YccA family protein [Erysipelotrichia bacterium]
MDLYENEQHSLGNVTLKQHMLKTFTWMFLGVLVTFVTAFIVGNSSLIYIVYGNSFMPLILIITQFGVVIALSARLFKMKESSAKLLFLAYSILTGITFSGLGYVYAGADIALAFGAAAIFFVCLVIIGATTKANLDKIGTICIAGLIAFVTFQILAMLFSWSMDVVMFSIIGLLLFTGITAWDVQKAKKLYNANLNDTQMLNKLSIYSAFELYLDFINIFLYILRILGNRD